MRRLTLAILAFLIALPFTPTFAPPFAYAQTQGSFTSASGQTVVFDQYPSFIQASIKIPTGAEVVIRCGYSQSATGLAPDPGYMEMVTLNQAAGSYARYQRIDNKIILTTTGNAAQGRMLLQVTEPTGATMAKSCLFNPDNDSIQGCQTAQPYAAALQATQEDQQVAQQCGSFFTKAQPTLNLATYSQQKTDIFKNTLRQKVMLLEAP